ncbi:hypothetical protein HETIRDRAFT_455067 [Heterobasidion irregulare TC 32-1]|uniref:MAGE domain-containing protein n=1 Tax=Heterobasidion irregulare (strain TC 32-1) TaxID=747525 RepID=W4JTV1_HETIT|nr:uncharacterized protein HETIRDRAFT_455067 [Heterobasidion irregulare TC 32-1]ETW76530.1 hypothetical protein HETIRDRAFT_455067 [Heterobasidion irregulare TC 32-1]
MARAGPSRSQRATQPSQSQPQFRKPNQSQRTRRKPRTPEEDEDDEGEAGQENDPDPDDDDSDSNEDQDLNQKAYSLVRLALFQEQKRLPLRREEISKKVLGSKRGSFKVVFEAAQNILRDTFGMELVELPTRAAAQESERDKKFEKDKTENEQNGGDENRQTLTGLKKKESAAATDASILAQESADAPDGDDDDEVGTNLYGSIIAWNSSDQLGALGILHVVLAIVLVNGRVISDMDLRTALKRLRLVPTASIPLSAASTHRSIQLEAYLSLLLRQGYLDRIRLGGSKGGNKRGRTTQSQAQTQHDGDGEVAWEWRWGVRAMTEIGEAPVARFVAEFIAERMASNDSESEDEDDNGEAARKRAKKRKEEANKRLDALTKGIEKAAGGDLQEVV